MSFDRQLHKERLSKIAKITEDRANEFAYCEQQITELLPRIKAVIELANACDGGGIKIPANASEWGYVPGYTDDCCAYGFVANHKEKQLGLIQPYGTDNPFYGVGFFDDDCVAVHTRYPAGLYVTGSGAYQYVRTTDGTNTVRQEKATLEMCRIFLKQFEVFETAFYKWIDSLETA